MWGLRNDPTALPLYLIDDLIVSYCILLMSADTLSSHRPGDGASLLGVSDP